MKRNAEHRNPGIYVTHFRIRFGLGFIDLIPAETAG